MIKGKPKPPEAGRRFQIIHLAEVREAHGNDEQQTADLYGRTHHVDPDTLLDAAKIDEVSTPIKARKMSQTGTVPTDDLSKGCKASAKAPAARRHGGEPGANDGQTNDIGKKLEAEGTLSDISRARPPGDNAKQSEA